ncbi:hypothetical protein HPB51_015213 [Rhipicephalus microplus]|uniref:DUF4806 domain-containing protein n=1 Tax=Rhipicephalus microplus TaxID=6941 RepID=A0A9J6EAC6_RHIMP|nr:hypothetical protein HPB51_015213 [Rhipicephalus microplus]
MAESADRKFRREINRRVNASFQLIDSEADVINDTRYVDRDSRNAERESDLPSEACAVDLEDGHRRLCVHDRERPSAHSSIVPETDVPQGHVLISGDACYPSGCSVSVPHDHTDFERRAFHDSSAAASTSATSQVRQRDSFELAPTGSNEEQVCERGSVDSLLAFRERLQAWALQSRASHTSVTSLLRVLQSHECFSALPSTARALLQTPKKCLEVLQLAGGKYHHFGLSAGLQRVLQDCAELPRILKLSFNIDEYVRQLMRISQTILMRLEQLGRQVDAMQQHLFNTTVRLQDETNDDVVLTPVKDIDQFLSLEGRLAADGNIKLKLIQQLAGLGGSTFGAAARRMLELLLSLEVAVQFSWAGQKVKRKFVDLGVTDVICKAVRRNFPETKKNDIECVIKVWLRHAGEKLQKQRLRTSRTHHEAVERKSPLFRRCTRRLTGSCVHSFMRSVGPSLCRAIPGRCGLRLKIRSLQTLYTGRRRGSRSLPVALARANACRRPWWGLVELGRSSLGCSRSRGKRRSLQHAERSLGSHLMLSWCCPLLHHFSK